MEKVAEGQRQPPCVHVLVADLKTCSKTRNLERGKRVYAEAVRCGHDSNSYVVSALINMYAKCSSMGDAHRVFENVKLPNVVAWTALILGYAENGQGRKALDLFTKMKSETPPNYVTLVAALKACISLVVNGWTECRKFGKELHCLAVENGWDTNIYVQSTLIDMYAKCSSMVDARQVFDSMNCQDVVSWNVLILGYADNGEGLAALELFMKMRSRGLALDSVTFVAALKACSSLVGKGGVGRCRDLGNEIHKLVIENGCGSNIYVRSSLLDMYAKCGNMVYARQIYNSIRNPDIVSVNALILGYVANGQGLDALDMFKSITCRGPPPDSVTFSAALKACTSLSQEASGRVECRRRGKEIYDLAVKSGYDSDVKLQNTLIDMYAKCGSMVEAHKVFNGMKCLTVVSWTALILGYVENGQCLAALDLFTGMRNSDTQPDSVIFAAALKICALLGALEFGRTLHSEIECGNHGLATSLVDFYAKCGSLMEAQSVFDLHAETRDVATWNALLGGFSSCGDKSTVFRLFDGMHDSGLNPDSVTFLCILTCCSHAGLVDKGKECFDMMFPRYGIVPAVQHCTCMIDIFGRGNKLDDAMALLERMPCSANYVTWMAILCACRNWKNVEIGRLAFQSLVNDHNRDSAAYVLMGQIYGSRGMLQEQEMVIRMSKRSLNHQPNLGLRLTAHKTIF